MKFSPCYEHLKRVTCQKISFRLCAFEPRETLPFPVLLVLVRPARPDKTEPQDSLVSRTADLGAVSLRLDGSRTAKFLIIGIYRDGHKVKPHFPVSSDTTAHHPHRLRPFRIQTLLHPAQIHAQHCQYPQSVIIKAVYSSFLPENRDIFTWKNLNFNSFWPKMLTNDWLPFDK